MPMDGTEQRREEQRRSFDEAVSEAREEWDRMWREMYAISEALQSGEDLATQ